MAAQSEVIEFTATPAGNQTLSLNGSFTPSTLILWAGPRTGTTETIDLNSIGAIDIPNAVNIGQSNLNDATSKQTKDSLTEWIHYNRSGGVIIKVISITGVSAAAGSVTINIGTAANYPVQGIAIA